MEEGLLPLEAGLDRLSQRFSLSLSYWQGGPWVNTISTVKLRPSP